MTIDAAINQREDITLTGKSIALNASITHENQGTIRLTATESLAFDTNKITTTDGTITLETDNAIVIEAGQIIPETGEMNIVATGDLKIDRFNTTANLQIENISGNIFIDLLQAENLTIDAQSIQFDEISAKAVTMKSTGAITETDDTETDMIAETIHLEGTEINLDIAGNAILTANAQNNIDISAAGDLNASHVESTSGSIKIQADGNNVGGGEIRADGQLTITDQIVQNKDFELIADRMVIHNDIKHQAGGQIILTSKQIEHQSGTIQTESRLQFNTEEITQTGGQILTDRLEIVSSGNAVFESSTNEINQLHATIDNGDFVFSHASDLQIDQVSANTVNLISINGSVLSDGSIDTIDIQAENVILSAAQDIKDITFADQTSHTTTADNIDILANNHLILVDLSASQISVQSNRQLAVGQMTADNIDLTASTITQHEGRITSQKLSLQADQMMIP
jgi:hypothetical protein